MSRRCLEGTLKKPTIIYVLYINKKETDFLFLRRYSYPTLEILCLQLAMDMP